eukprot:4644135-Pyramimonas_sp.AAC.1
MALDSGPEAKIDRARTSVEVFFPWWFSLAQEGGEYDIPEDDNPDPRDHPLDTSHIIVIPGTYHVIELIEQRMLGHLEAYEEIKPQIESAAYILHHKWSREAFIRERLTGRSRLNACVAQGCTLLYFVR